MINPDEIKDLESAREEIRQLMKRVEKMLHEIDGLKQENKELRNELEEAKRAGKRQATPFSKGEPKENPKKPGQKEGHKAMHRAVPQKIDRVREARLPVFCECGGTIVKDDQKPQYQSDIQMPVPVIVTQFNVEIGHCPDCKKRHQGRHAEQTSDALGAANVQIGSNMIGMAAALKHQHGMSYGAIAGFTSGLTNGVLGVCRSMLVRAETRAAKRLEPTYQQLMLRLRTGRVTYVDETGWKVGGKPAWLWVFTNDEFTVYAIDPTRAHEVVERVLGKNYAGILKTDGFAAYDSEDLSAIKKSKCLGHLIRRGVDVAALKSGKAAEFGQQVVKLLQAAIRLKQRQRDMTEHGYRVARGRLEAGLNLLLARSRRHETDEDNARFARLLIKHRDALFNFLDVPECEATNNKAERAIRPSVIIRKTNGCNRTVTGTNTHQVLASILQTCKQQGKSFAAFFTALLRMRGPVHLEFASTPEAPA
jgi:transposase